MIDREISNQPVKIKLSSVIELTQELNRCVDIYKANPSPMMRGRIEAITFCLKTLNLTYIEPIIGK